MATSTHDIAIMPTTKLMTIRKKDYRSGIFAWTSGNPPAVPRHSRKLVTLVRESTRDCRTLIHLLVRIAGGNPLLGRKPTLAGNVGERIAARSRAGMGDATDRLGFGHP
jgi:hypothetical protein